MSSCSAGSISYKGRNYNYYVSNIESTSVLLSTHAQTQPNKPIEERQSSQPSRIARETRTFIRWLTLARRAHSAHSHQEFMNSWWEWALHACIENSTNNDASCIHVSRANAAGLCTIACHSSPRTGPPVVVSISAAPRVWPISDVHISVMDTTENKTISMTQTLLCQSERKLLLTVNVVPVKSLRSVYV